MSTSVHVPWGMGHVSWGMGHGSPVARLHGACFMGHGTWEPRGATALLQVKEVASQITPVPGGPPRCTLPHVTHLTVVCSLHMHLARCICTSLRFIAPHATSLQPIVRYCISLPVNSKQRHLGAMICNNLGAMSSLVHIIATWGQ